MKLECASAKTEWQRKWLRLDCYHPQLQVLADEAQSFCLRWFYNQHDGKTLLILAGKPNCAKTHTAKRIAWYCRCSGFYAFECGSWDRGGKIPSVSFVSWPEVTDGFKEGHYGILEDLMTVDMLAIDDLGAEHDPSKNAADKLCQVLSRREKKFTVITTNIEPAQWPDRFDARIADRLMRWSVVVDLSDVPSYALQG